MSLIPNDVQTEQAPTQVETATEATETPAGYLYAEGIEAEGNAPEWFKSSKYKTISDQAAAYPELEKRFGSFQGAPKDGKYEIEGVEIEGNPLMELVAEWGIENQLSADGFGALVNKVNELAQSQIQTDRENSLKELGDNANERLATLAQWGRNNLDPEEFTQFQGLAQNAGQVKVLEKMISMSKNSKLVDTKQTTPQNTKESREAELKEMQLATDENGRRLMDYDQAHRAKVNRAMKEFYGS